MLPNKTGIKKILKHLRKGNKMFDLGQEIYYADPKDGVKKGIVLGYSVNEQGHDVYSIKIGEVYIVVFASLCFSTEEPAKEEYARIKPINDKIKEVQKEANEKIDALLEEMHGTPKFEHLTLKAERNA